MHGLINRSIQIFVEDTYGPDLWHRIAADVALPPAGFEAMWQYADGATVDLLDRVVEVIGHPRDVLLEDLGVFLVSNPRTETVRRLLRFGGESYVDFLHSLDDLQDRARLAVPDLEMPRLHLSEHPGGHYTLDCAFPLPGFGLVLVGLLRAMADDYGALVTIHFDGVHGGTERIDIHLADSDFSEGREFDLAATSVAARAQA